MHVAPPSISSSEAHRALFPTADDGLNQLNQGGALAKAHESADRYRDEAIKALDDCTDGFVKKDPETRISVTEMLRDRVRIGEGYAHTICTHGDTYAVLCAFPFLTTFFLVVELLDLMEKSFGSKTPTAISLR